ncbi:unnamed protein product [Rhizoctonia solani]|nr:unnamed protein product [Rhizoctonia solani]
MAPRSSKRVRAAGSRPADDGSHSNDTFHATILTPETVGRRGFLAFPDELVYLIFSYYTEIRVEDILINPTHLPGHFLDRFKALRNLSQLCQLARRTYLPLLWERVQICVATGSMWYKEHGNNLVRKCNGLLKSQHLWPYVRKVTVCLTRFETNKVLPPFVRLLQTLPNIQALEIPHAHGSITSILKSHFEGNTFPTIRRVVMPTCAHEILRCCPGIQDVSCNEGDGGTLISAMVSAGCKNLQVLDGIAAGLLQMKKLAKENPPLQRVRVNIRMKNPQTTIQAFSKFPSLRIIEIDSDDQDVDYLVKIASDTLRGGTGCLDGGPTKGQKGAASIDRGRLDPIDPNESPTDVKVVRVLRFNRRGWRYLVERQKWTAAQFIPTETIEFPVS